MNRVQSLLFAAIAAGLLVAVALVPVGRTAETPLILQRNVVVDHGVVRLSDIFVGIDQAKDVDLFFAPEPGRRTVLDYRWLARVARAYKLDWRPSSRLDGIVVERSSQLLDSKLIREHLAKALAAEGIDSEVAIELAGGGPRVYLPGQISPQSMGLETLNIDKGRRRFSAVLSVGPDEPGGVRFAVSGRYHLMVRIPVLVRPMRPGDVIRRGDVEWIAVRNDRLNRDTVRELEQMLGRTPRRPAKAGQPLRADRLQAPVLVRKGSLVTVTVRRRNMVLTIKGRAMENGARDGVVRIANLKSNTVFEAVVSGPGRAVIAASAVVASNP